MTKLQSLSLIMQGANANNEICNTNKVLVVVDKITDEQFEAIKAQFDREVHGLPMISDVAQLDNIELTHNVDDLILFFEPIEDNIGGFNIKKAVIRMDGQFFEAFGFCYDTPVDFGADVQYECVNGIGGTLPYIDRTAFNLLTGK